MNPWVCGTSALTRWAGRCLKPLALLGLALLLSSLPAMPQASPVSQLHQTPENKPQKTPKDKSRDRKAHALIAGTIFRDPGFAFPGVAVLLEPVPGEKTSAKLKKMDFVSDSRGEFAFRVPPVPMRYNLTFQANGHTTEKRTVTISGEERQDIYVTLQAVKEGAR